MAQAWNPATHKGEQDGIRGSWLHPGSNTAIAAILGVTADARSVSLSLVFYL